MRWRRCTDSFPASRRFSQPIADASRDNLAIDRDPDHLLSKIRAFAKSAKGDKAVQEDIGFSVKAKWDVEGCKKKSW